MSDYATQYKRAPLYRLRVYMTSRWGRKCRYRKSPVIRLSNRSTLLLGTEVRRECVV